MAAVVLGPEPEVTLNTVTRDVDEVDEGGLARRGGRGLTADPSAPMGVHTGGGGGGGNPTPAPATSGTAEVTISRVRAEPSLWDLVREHFYITLLMAFNLVMMDNNNIFMVFLLVQTREGCHFHDDGGAYVKSQTVSLVAVFLFRPFTSYITDRFPDHNHVLLFVAAVAELLGLVAMLLLIALTPSGTLDPWPILGLSVFKQCAEVQINNSIYKIFKMRLVNKCKLDTCDSQCRVISTVGICGEAIELSVNMTSCAAAYYFIMHGASFDVIKYWYLGITLVGNCACLVLAGMIMRAPGEYYTAYVPRVGLKPSPINEIRMTETVPAAPSSSNVSETSALLLPSSTDDSRPTHPRRSASSCSYVARAASAIACTPIAVGAIVHMSLVYSSQELLYDAQSLAVPGAHINATNAACTDNFCAGYLTNTVFQDVFENAFYLLGTTFFVLVLRKTKPHVFYGWVFPVCMSVLLGVSVFLSRPETGQLELALSMTAVVAFTYFFFLYGKYLSTAAVAAEWYGFYSFVVGTMQSLVDLAIYGAMEAKVANSTLLYTMYAFMATTVLFSLGFGLVYRGVLKNAVHACL